MRHTIETAPNVVILDASRARRGFAISWIPSTLVTATLIGFCLNAEVVAYLARYATQQESSKLITIIPPAMAQQTPLPRDDEAAQLKQAVDSATAELRQSLQQEHDRAEALEKELVKAWRYVGKLLSMRNGEADQFSQAVDNATAVLWQSLQQEHDRAEALATELADARRSMKQKPAAVEEMPGVSLPAWANSYAAFMKPAQTAVQPDVSAENSKSAIIPGEPARVEHKPRGGSGCQHFQSYDPVSGTYMGYDGRRHSCP
ncbi:BA14K family protein [Bradyrhizobium sp. CB2312]|uniref:BA14K family protein n=1 Tax=Bradyrhizobium sp. CB2312 TaxID=3039155 RepID=UPI0024B05F9B|nr:BA14K family protein [Bradyrhizobium sp. CB2312]WFU75144.1 BA14K family protein [Bradyrhizobium sp. CB2312]